MNDLTPGSAEWARRVSPSKAAAILGISPWDSPRSMWHKMRGDIPWDEESPAMERGNLCEPAVLAWWRKHNPGHSEYREQVSLTIGDWCVATPDALAVVDGDLVLVEAKTGGANTDDTWGAPGTDEIPLYYLAQVYLAMHVCHLNGIPVVRADVPLLGGRRNLFSQYVVAYDAENGAAILDRLEAFHATLDADTPPDLDDTVATYDAVRKAHPEIDRGEEVELDHVAAHDLVWNKSNREAYEREERLAKSRVLELMGRAQYATHDGVRIARRQPRGDDVTFVVVAKPSDLTDTQGDAA